MGVYNTRKERTMLEIQRRTQCVASQPVTDEEDQSLYFKAASLKENFTQERKIQ